MCALENIYTPQNFWHFDFRLTSNNGRLRELATQLVSDLRLKTKRLDDVKVDLMVCILSNLRLGAYRWKCMAISRRSAWYAKIPEQERLPIQSYDFVTNTLDALIDAGLIMQDLGYHSEDDKHLTKIHPTEVLRSRIAFLTNADLVYTLPETVLVLRDDDGNPVDFPESNDTKAMTAQINAYNDLLSNTVVGLSGLTDDDTSEHAEYLLKYTDYNNRIATAVTLRPMRMRRIFNRDFEHGGRFYGGIENMPAGLRPKITIGGKPTVELDFAAYQLRMLYHLKGINYKKDAYAVASGYKPEHRDIYKIIALAALNAETEVACLKGIRNELRKDTTYTDLIGRITDARIKPLLTNWVTAHRPISDYMYSGIGLELQRRDSDIAAGVLSYFQRKNVLVLSVHDSFLIESVREKELRSKMRKTYKAEFGFYPVIN